MNQEYMKEKPILPLVLTMGYPMVLSMLINSLYNIIDSYFVAKISGDAMTALSLVFPVQNLAHSVAVGFGIGINSAIAISLGEKDYEEANRAMTYGINLSVIHGLLSTIICVLVMPNFLSMFHPTSEVLSIGLRYSNIVFLFAAINNVGVSLEKVFQSVGWMKVTMFSMMSGCLLNIIFDPILIFGYGPFPRLEIEGAAIATGLGQVLAVIIYIVIYKKRSIGVKYQKTPKNGQTVFRLYSVGIPATLNMALPSVLIAALNSILVAYSQIYVLILGVYYKLQTFIYMPANGIIQGMRPIIGYNYGANEKERVQKIFQVVLKMCLGIMIVGMLLCILLPKPIISLFSDDYVVIVRGIRALRIICLGFAVSSISVTASGALEGLGKGWQSLVISLLRYVVLIIPVAWLLSFILGPEGVWWAFVLTEIITAGISLLIYKKTV
ncbi:Multi antimicrobial extrusion protein (Na(+)/drug antiporter), MATE family of MDR efflux pump [Lachnospiraceae bacterium TWA4]|nr:Multi antimicrobial extrusion protein (Na(+)/drug antiporter), MATE family of MDR efflux pump [Lachnospiraceae bacterium TWA4]